MNDFIQKAKAVMIGHAVGDALGVPVEFRTREYLKYHPITDMVGYGTHNVPKGAWSDDTSMSLCALDVISASGVDLNKVMKNFGKWLYQNAFTATDDTFDVGATCQAAIDRFMSYGLPINKCGLSDDYSNGNGSLMRIHPFVLYLIKNYSVFDLGLIHAASMLTHAHLRSKIGCGIYAYVLRELLSNPCKASVAVGLRAAKEFYEKYKINAFNSELQNFGRLFDGIDKLAETEIQSSGYVVHTLEAAIWCLLTTGNYKDCVLKAVNLGGDTDTTAAVAGGLAGALYGYDAIPEDWRNTLLKREYIEALCEKAFGE